MTSSGVGPDEEAIKAIEAEFAAAWAAHDAKHLAEFWLEDGDFMNPLGRFARGRKELEAFFREEHAGVMRASTYSFNLDSVRPVAPDVLVTDWTNVIRGMIAANGEALPPLTHHVTTVFVRRQGRWWKSSTRVTVLLPPPSGDPPGPG